MPEGNIWNGIGIIAQNKPVAAPPVRSLPTVSLCDASAHLLDALGAERAGRPHRVIDACVATLRRKIETDPRKPAVIRTVRGIGYTLVG